MLRLSRAARHAATAGGKACLYETLGLTPAASEEEIKRAFRERSKELHPDAGGSGRDFRDLVDAYRTLRDPKRRATYDREQEAESQAARRRAAFGQGYQRGPGEYQQQYRGYGEGFSEDARSYMFGSRGPPPGAGAAAGPAGPTHIEIAGFAVERAIIAATFLSGAFFVWFTGFGQKAEAAHEADPYPSRRPHQGSAREAATAGGASSSASTAQKGAATLPEEEVVAAYYNPFAQVWQRIPEGYEPPSSMDLTAWHQKRTDPVEWSRLFAEGKLSEIIPRGGLKVRFMPAWKTYEPVIVKDPFTGKTLNASDKLPPRNSKVTCEVEF